MTAYEIAELRAAIGDRLLNILRFWLTVTMAAFAVAYYTGARLDGFSIAALIAFQGMMSFLMGMLVVTAMRHIDALALDAKDLIGNGGGAAISQVKMIEVPAAGPRTILSMFAITFVVFVAYLTRMSL
jgi:hypothetical protein